MQDSGADDLRRTLESLGQVSAALVHGINNTLTAVIGCADMLMLRHGSSEEDRLDLLEIQKAGRRGALLAHQLLALSDPTPPDPVSVDLNRILDSAYVSIRGLVPDGISLTCDVDQTPALVCVDPPQIEQALINLVLNVQDAVRRGSVRLDLAILPSSSEPETVSVRITGTSAAPGATDDECSPLILPHHPRLNVTAAYELVRRNGGTLSIDRGACAIAFTVTFRAVAAQPSGTLQPLIFVIDDDDAVRNVVARLLRANGYRVVEADTASAAMAAFDAYQDDVALVLADVWLGDVSGIDLVERLTTYRPSLRAVVMSGHESALADARYSYAVPVLDKPFTGLALVETIRRTLADRN